MECLFCNIVNKEIASKILYEDDKVLVFLDINQSNVGHTLVIPKKHIKDIKECPSDILNHMLEVAIKMGDKIIDKLGATGISYNINYGDAQEIKHLHLHICPFYKGKKEKIDIEEIFDILK